MPLIKNFLKTRAICRVKFIMPPEAVNGADKLFLVGDFNDWNTTTCPMKRLKDGTFTLEVPLAAGQDFQYRYLTDAGFWLNDTEADEDVPCSFAGTEKSLGKV